MLCRLSTVSDTYLKGYKRFIIEITSALSPNDNCFLVYFVRPYQKYYKIPGWQYNCNCASVGQKRRLSSKYRYCGTHCKKYLAINKRLLLIIKKQFGPKTMQRMVQIRKCPIKESRESNFGRVSLFTWTKNQFRNAFFYFTFNRVVGDIQYKCLACFRSLGHN